MVLPGHFGARKSLEKPFETPSHAIAAVASCGENYVHGFVYVCMYFLHLERF